MEGRFLRRVATAQPLRSLVSILVFSPWLLLPGAAPTARAADPAAQSAPADTGRAVPAAAADPAAAPAPPPAPPLHPIGSVSVSATRSERDVLEVAGHVTLIERTEIERSGVDNLPDLLRREAGLFVTSSTGHPAGTQVEARGFNNGGSLGSSLLVRVDGRRVNEADTGNTDWALIPLEWIESVEILRGPASAVYGDNAVGGVIDIRTRPRPGPARARLSGNFGSYESRGGSLAASGSAGPLSANLLAHGYESDSYRRRAEYERKSVNASLQSELGGRFVAGVRSGLFEDQRDFPGALDPLELESLGRRAADPDSLDDASEVRDHFVEGWFEGAPVEGLELRLRPNYRWRDDETEITSIVFGGTSIDTDKESGGGDLQLQYDRTLFGHDNRLVFGAELLHEETRRRIESLFGIQDSDNQRDVIGVYVQNEFDLSEDLLLSTGLRYDHAELDLAIHDPIHDDRAGDDPDFDLWSPRLSLLWRVCDPVSLYASYSRGFRLPNFDEDAPLLGYPPGSPPLLPELDPQRSDSVELGAKHRSERLEADLVIYWMEVRNEITYDPFTFSNQNFERVRHRGLEASLSWWLLDWLRADGSYSFEQVVIREPGDAAPFGDLEDRRMPMTPRHRGSVGLFARLPQQIEFGASANLVGSRPLANDFDRELALLPAYATLDLLLAWRPAFGEHLSGALSFALRNATDEKYSDYAARYDQYDPFPVLVPTKYRNPAAGRHWEVGFQITVSR